MTELTPSPSVLASLGINLSSFLSQLLDVAIILFVMWRWVYRPLFATLEERRAKIAEGVKQADDAKKILAQAESEHDTVVRAARAEGSALIQQATADSDRIRAEKVTATKMELEKIANEAKASLKTERENMLRGATAELGDVVIAALEKVAAALPEKEKKHLVDAALKDMKS